MSAGLHLLTDREREVWGKVADAARAYMALAADDPIHPMEAEEIAHAIHDVQSRLLARPMLRSLGWPQRPVTVEPAHLEADPSWVTKIT